MSQVEANEQLVRRLFEEAWNRKSHSALHEMLAKDCVVYGPGPDAVLRGPASLRALHADICRAFPDLNVVIQDVIAAGDRVAARWRANGTHLGDGLGFTATGRPVTLDGTMIGVIQAGRIREAWHMMDMHRLFESLRSEPLSRE